MNLTFREDYWDDSKLKAEFNRFLDEIHGLNLTRWDEYGYWDREYRPFSFFDGNRLVASLCVYSMDMTVLGKRTRVAQISGVGTAAEYRRKGLNSELTRIALDWARPKHDFFFLFADEEARPFYKAGGFREVKEHRISCTAPRLAIKQGLRPLEIANDDDRALIEQLARERTPISDRLGVHNWRLLMFWCLYFLKDNLYYIEELDTVVMLGRKDGTLTLHDVLAREVPPLHELYPFVGHETDRTIEFMFMTDKMGLDPSSVTLNEVDLGTYLMGDVPFESEPFQFPCTSHA